MFTVTVMTSNYNIVWLLNPFVTNSPVMLYFSVGKILKFVNFSMLALNGNDIIFLYSYPLFHLSTYHNIIFPQCLVAYESVRLCSVWFHQQATLYNKISTERYCNTAEGVSASICTHYSQSDRTFCNVEFGKAC